jgi:hypothetical protein
LRIRYADGNTILQGECQVAIKPTRTISETISKEQNIRTHHLERIA